MVEPLLEEREARTAEPLTRAREICGDGMGFLKIWSFFESFWSFFESFWRCPPWIHPKPAKMLDLACVWEVLREFERDFERVWESLRGFGECLRGFESLKIYQNLSKASGIEWKCMEISHPAAYSNKPTDLDPTPPSQIPRPPPAKCLSDSLQLHQSLNRLGGLARGSDEILPGAMIQGPRETNRKIQHMAIIMQSLGPISARLNCWRHWFPRIRWEVLVREIRSGQK